MNKDEAKIAARDRKIRRRSTSMVVSNRSVKSVILAIIAKKAKS